MVSDLHADGAVGLGGLLDAAVGVVGGHAEPAGAAVLELPPAPHPGHGAGALLLPLHKQHECIFSKAYIIQHHFSVSVGRSLSAILQL